jgi:hypothetical protein
MTDEHEPPIDSEDPENGYDIRFAPPADESDAPEADDLPSEREPEVEAAPEPASLTDEELTAAPEVDLDAALAAISALDDILAEQEAAEQAEIERQRTEEQARADQQVRLQHPEQFFPMPSMATMQRGRIDSVVPALVLIGIGAWLTFALTAGSTAPSATLLIIALCGGFALTLLARWLASGRWAMGALFFALLMLLTGGIFAYLLTQGTLITWWPLLLAGPGLAFLLTGVIVGESRLLLPGVVIAVSSLAAMLVTNGALPAAALTTLAGLWPVALILIAILGLLPLVARRS